ncbi:hypothetical protein B0H15DRAFT_864487 [Mycena belliarum]|uniref:Uncharacterized protein n=1 Tax=Mycena belliarum TaxID=1033014 RepID=A0AAD6TVF3_9AGAR|nr:hypothetical protein B0H15DRAFT_864487 [Mycena belliae]
MAQNSPQKPHAHSVDLLRNRDPLTPLGPFDGKAAAHAQIGAKHFFITTNADYVPAVPSLQLPHKVYLRTDMRYGPDDPTLWPQQYAAYYCHLPLISRKGARPELNIMWWNPTRSDFEVGSAITRGLGKLGGQQLARLLPPINDLVPRCKQFCRNSPTHATPLFGQLMQQVLMWIEQLQALPTTYTKMLFAVTSLQRTFLELDALYKYMSVYKERMNNYLAQDVNADLGQFVGAFTTVPTVAQQFWAAGLPFWFIREYEVFDSENILSVVPLSHPNFDLPDPDAHGEGAPPSLYTGNSTMEKIEAIHRAAQQTPWYTDPFETGFTRTPSQPRDPASGSTSRAIALSAAPISAPIPSSSHAVAQSGKDRRYKPYPAQPTAKVPAKAKAPNNAAKVERDKFARLAVAEMPPYIVSMANALASVDRSVVPYTSNAADRRYVLPEPALLVNSTSERRRRFLHHWTLLADGFIYMLTQRQPLLLSGQEWRDILEGLMNERGPPGSRRNRRSSKLEEHIRPALEASNVTSLEGFPVPLDQLRHFTLKETHEIVWQVAETGFRLEFCALDRRASGQERVDDVRGCFAGHMLVGAPLHLGKQGWASGSLEERHRYVGRTACLMLDWTSKTACPDVIRRVKEHSRWSLDRMQELETAVCGYYTQSFWEYFGRAAVLPMRLEHELEQEPGEL